MFNRLFKFGTLILLGAMLAFTSCEKEEGLLIEDFGPTTDSLLFNGRGPHSPGLHELGDRCFELVFPVTVEFPDGTKKEVANKDQYLSAINTWRKNNPRVKGMPKIAFPYEVMLKDGTVTTIENMEDLKDILDNCRPVRGPHTQSCYQVVFPVTLKFPDSTSKVINSAEAFKAALEAWRAANPEAKGHPTIAFPYSIKLNNGTVVILNSIQDLREAIHACRENRPHRPSCFKVVYPVTVVFPGGSTASASSRDAFMQLVRDWRAKNPNVEGRPTMKFPIKVELKDGTTVTVESKEALDALAKNCKG